MIVVDLYCCVKMVGHDNVFVQNDVRIMLRNPFCTVVNPFAFALSGRVGVYVYWFEA